MQLSITEQLAADLQAIRRLPRALQIEAAISADAESEEAALWRTNCLSDGNRDGLVRPRHSGPTGSHEA